MQDSYRETKSVNVQKPQPSIPFLQILWLTYTLAPFIRNGKNTVIFDAPKNSHNTNRELEVLKYNPYCSASFCVCVCVLGLSFFFFKQLF